MQIKIRGNKVQLLRSEYVQAERDENGSLVRGTGRCSQRLVGSFSRGTESVDEVPVEVKEKLIEEEKEQLIVWLKEKTETRIKAEKERALESLSRQMELATQALGEGSLLTEDEAQKLFLSWGKFQKALRKSGHKRISKKE